MSVTNVTPIIDFTADGTPGLARDLPYKLLQASDLSMYIDGVLSTDGFTVGGTLPDAATATTTVNYDSGTTVTFKREVEYKQETTFSEGERYPGDRIENEFDNLEMQIQQVKEEIGRTIQSAPGTEGPDGVLEKVASSTIGQDASGELVSRTVTEEVEHLGLTDVAALSDDAAAAVAAAAAVDAAFEEYKQPVQATNTFTFNDVADVGTVSVTINGFGIGFDQDPDDQSGSEAATTLAELINVASGDTLVTAEVQNTFQVLVTAVAIGASGNGITCTEATAEGAWSESSTSGGMNSGGLVLHESVNGNYLRHHRYTFTLTGASAYGGNDPNGEYTWTPADNAFVKGSFKIHRNIAIVSGVVTTTWYLDLSTTTIGTRVNSTLTGPFTISDANYGSTCEVESSTRSLVYSDTITDITDALNECAYGDEFVLSHGNYTYAGLPYDDTDDAIGNHKMLSGGLVLKGAGMTQTTIKLVIADHSTNDGGTIFQAIRTSGGDRISDLTIDANAEENITSIGVYHDGAGSEDTTAGESGVTAQVETFTVPESFEGYTGDLNFALVGADFTDISATVDMATFTTAETIAAELHRLITLGTEDVTVEWNVVLSGAEITFTRLTLAANDATMRANLATADDYVSDFEFPSRQSTANYGLNPHYGCFLIRGENTVVERCRFIGWTGGGCNIWTGTNIWTASKATKEQYANSDSGRYTMFDGCVFEHPVDVAFTHPYTNALSCRFGGVYCNNIVIFPETSDDYWALGDDDSQSGAATFAFGVNDNTTFENNLAYNCEAMFHRDTLAINHCAMRGNRSINTCYGVLFQMTEGDIARNITIEENTFEIRALNGGTSGRGILFTCNHSANATFGVKIHGNTLIGESAADFGILMGNNTNDLDTAPFMDGVSFLNNTTGYILPENKKDSIRVFDGDINNTFQDVTGSTFPMGYSRRLTEGFYDVEKATKPDITGITGSNTALEDLLTKLVDLGIITDSTTIS